MFIKLSDELEFLKDELKLWGVWGQAYNQQKEVQSHYDIGNVFYKLRLDNIKAAHLLPKDLGTFRAGLSSSH
ncbi:MAG: hypothetical protein HFI77_06075 [Lachnospiraceae bacterium]|nr:hypothetical protein [Lachnospiraceae bacterium]